MERASASSLDLPRAGPAPSPAPLSASASAGSSRAPTPSPTPTPAPSRPAGAHALPVALPPDVAAHAEAARPGELVPATLLAPAEGAAADGAAGSSTPGGNSSGAPTPTPTVAAPVALRPVAPDERVRADDVVLRDAGTQRLYAVHHHPHQHHPQHHRALHGHAQPAYSLAHTKGAPALAPADRGGRIGIAHAFPAAVVPAGAGGAGRGSPSASPRASTDGARPPSARTGPSRPASRAGAGAHARDDGGAGGAPALVEQLRGVIRDEVRAAARAHALELRAHTAAEARAAAEGAVEERQGGLAERIARQASEIQQQQQQEAQQHEEAQQRDAAQQQRRRDSDGSDGKKSAGDATTVRNEDAPVQEAPELRQQRSDGVPTAAPAIEHELESDAGEGGSDDGDDDDEGFPNPIARLRYHLREPLAEFLGCFILIVFGNGGNQQYFLSSMLDAANAKGTYTSVSFFWGIGTMFGIQASGGISGGIINPAVTIALAVFRGFPWRKVPIYITAQILGATLGALCIYGLYHTPLQILDPQQTQKTASLFTTFPADFLQDPSKRIFGYYNEMLATAVLLIIVLAIGDANNCPPVDGMAPLYLMWAVFGIGAALGWQTAYAINPARDLGPRLALTIVGYEGLWTFDAGYWAHTPLAGSVSGALLGAFIYDLFVYTGPSPLNKRWTFADLRLRRIRQRREESKLHKAARARGAATVSEAADKQAPESFDSIEKQA